MTAPPVRIGRMPARPVLERFTKAGTLPVCGGFAPRSATPIVQVLRAPHRARSKAKRLNHPSVLPTPPATMTANQHRWDRMIGWAVVYAGGKLWNWRLAESDLTIWEFVENERMNQREVLIQLRPVIDASQPILKAIPQDGYGKQYRTVRVVTEHPVWRGVVLRHDHFTVVQSGELVG
jgi:hypothetical protein